jgi:PTS system fructose-specific IIC component
MSITPTSVIGPELIHLDVALGSTRDQVIRSLADLVVGAGRASSADPIVEAALAREAQSPTGMQGGIAIPHCRSAAVTSPTVAFARLPEPVDFGAKDGGADLIFLIAVPEGAGADHLAVLTELARSLVRPGFTDSLRSAGDTGSASAIINGAVSHAAATADPTAPAEPGRRLVAVTACPTGIAHTYMAAEALQAAAARAGVHLDVETQGSGGSKPLSAEVIRQADAVIFASDVGVRDRGRFSGKPVVTASVKRGIDDADQLVATAVSYIGQAGAPVVSDEAHTQVTNRSGDESWGLRTRRVLMTGVSYMIPFVAAGGLLIALAFLLGGYEIAVGDAKATIMDKNSLTNLPDPAALGLDHAMGGLGAYLGAVLLTLGGTAFGFLVPALAGYIAFAIADRPGIAPGFVMGAIAASDSVKAGFLGGIVGGVLAGVVAYWISQRQVPTWLRGLMPVLIIPLGATLVAGAAMLLVLAKPLAALMESLNDGLTSLNGGSAIVLGIVIGLMMAFDMGGPLNKVAYTFGVTGLGAAATATNAPELKVMAAVMLAGMVPPIALALATVVRPRLFSEPERENGKAAWLMGASFITEGAIPFAAADPLRVIPSIMLGSAVTGGLSMALDVSLRAPHGGIFVLFAVGHVLSFLFALLAGVLVASASVIALKSFTESKEEIDQLAAMA